MITYVSKYFQTKFLPCINVPVAFSPFFVQKGFSVTSNIYQNMYQK